MKDRRERAKQVRQRKVAALAAYSRQHTVKNCTIPKVDEKDLINKEVSWGVIKAVKGTAEWNIPKEGFPQPKRLRKKYKKKYYCKEYSCKGSHEIRKIVSHESDYKQFKDCTFHPNTGRAWYMEQIVQHKLAKWEKKNPRPIKEDQNPPDIFEKDFMIPWKAKREQALERIRDFVVSIYDKLPLSGRFKETDNKYIEEKVADIKDVNMEGHCINDLNPDKSKLLKIAQKKTNETKAKRHNLVCTKLKDHKRQKGRIILPNAA